jgi:hypothetical protein
MWGGDAKYIDVHPIRPDGIVHHEHKEFPKEAFRPEPFSASWDDNNYLKGRLAPDGEVLGYDLKVCIGDFGDRYYHQHRHHTLWGQVCRR